MSAAILVPALASSAATLVVDTDGTYDAATTTCTGSDAAFTLIQSAVTAAANGDTIVVCPGTYAEAQILINKALTVQSVAGATSTIIDGLGGSGLVAAGTVWITATAGNVMFDGFTVQNAKSQANGTRFNIRVGSAAAVTITVTNNVLIGRNNPLDGVDYGLYAAGPTAIDTFVFQYNELRNHGSNTILIERHRGPTDVSYNTFTRGVRSTTISAYVNMSHSGDAITALQKVSYNTINMANDAGPYDATNSSNGIVFTGALTGASLGSFSNVEISHNTITNLRSFRRGIVLNNNANSLANQALGVISNAIISCNEMTWSGSVESGSMGVRLIGFVSNPTITNNTINGVDVGLRAEPRASHITDMATANTNFIGNTGVAAVDWQPTGALTAESNWWGSATGPTNAGNPGGTGGILLATGPVDFNPWLASGGDADVGPCFVPGCGNGATDLNEDCDQGVLNGDPGACCSLSCTYRAGGQECRAAIDDCDSPENCTGSSGSCPADQPATAGTACGSNADTACDNPDSCDGFGSCLANNQSALTECRAAMGACDIAENCDGVGSCPADSLQPDGISCAGNGSGACTGADTCSSGVCSNNNLADGTVCSGNGSNVCSAGDSCLNGICNDNDLTSGTVCMTDDDTCTDDECNGLGTCEHPDNGSCITGYPACPAAPMAGCKKPTSKKAVFVLRDNTDDANDRMSWRWRKGEATLSSELGDPVDGSTSYAFCVYDYSGNVPSLSLATGVAAGGLCNGGPCWRRRGSGFVYSSPDGIPGGVRRLELKAGGAGKARVVLRAKGADLPMPTPVSVTQLFAQDQKVTAQLFSNAGVCWDADFSLDPRRNSAKKFRDFSD